LLTPCYCQPLASDCGSANGKHLSGYGSNHPFVEDDRIFETALVKVCGFWLLDTLMRHGGLERALRKDFLWEFYHAPAALGSIEAFITTSREFNQLPGLRGTSSRLLDLLRQRWSDVPHLPSSISKQVHGSILENYHLIGRKGAGSGGEKVFLPVGLKLPTGNGEQGKVVPRTQERYKTSLFEALLLSMGSSQNHLN